MSKLTYAKAKIEIPKVLKKFSPLDAKDYGERTANKVKMQKKRTDILKIIN